MRVDIREWLAPLDLGKYAETFVENEIGIRDLPCWLTRAEPIPEGERDAAHALGQRRLIISSSRWPRSSEANEVCRLG